MFVDFNARKIQLVSFEWSYKFGTIGVKINEPILEDCWGLIF